MVDERPKKQARLVTMMAQDTLGQPIVILNKPGAGGQVGWNHLVSQGKEDGYDLAAYNVPHFIAQSIVEQVIGIRYDQEGRERVQRQIRRLLESGVKP